MYIFFGYVELYWYNFFQMYSPWTCIEFIWNIAVFNLKGESIDM